MGQLKISNYLEPRALYNRGECYSLSTWRKKILERDEETCQNCLNTITDWLRDRPLVIHAHHIIPRTHGGKNTIHNGITLCMFCHHYFDLYCLRYDQDYFEILNSKQRFNRIVEVKQLMRKRYIRHMIRLFSMII